MLIQRGLGLSDRYNARVSLKATTQLGEVSIAGNRRVVLHFQ